MYFAQGVISQVISDLSFNLFLFTAQGIMHLSLYLVYYER